MGITSCIICQGNRQGLIDDNTSNIFYSNRSVPSTSIPKDYSLSFKFRSINYSDKNNSKSVIPSYYSVSQLSKQQTFQGENVLSSPKLQPQQSNSYINIVIIGGKGVGKSCFLIKSVNNKFEKLYIPTIGIEKIRRAVRLEGVRYSLNFIVTPGDEKYRGDYSVIFRDVSVLLLFYDLSDMDSFNVVVELFGNMYSLYKDLFDNKMPVLFLVGTKADKPKAVNSEVIKEFCVKHKINSSVEISAKNGVGIKGLINNMIKATQVK